MIEFLTSQYTTHLTNKYGSTRSRKIKYPSNLNTTRMEGLNWSGVWNSENSKKKTL